MNFEWSAGKAEANLKKHGIAFTEAGSVFSDPLAITFYDLDHSETEQRYLTFGVALSGRSLVVAHASRGDTIRTISARLMTSRERRQYEQYEQG